VDGRDAEAVTYGLIAICPYVSRGVVLVRGSSEREISARKLDVFWRRTLVVFYGLLSSKQKTTSFAAGEGFSGVNSSGWLSGRA
jgi:hypothetical protein